MERIILCLCHVSLFLASKLLGTRQIYFTGQTLGDYLNIVERPTKLELPHECSRLKNIYCGRTHIFMLTELGELFGRGITKAHRLLNKDQDLNKRIDHPLLDELRKDAGRLEIACGENMTIMFMSGM